MAKGTTHEQGDVETITRESTKTKRPRQYRVILLNDDYTSMDFVIMILERVFRKTPAEAVEIMLHVHERGQGVAGIYTKEIAETKIDQVHRMAKEHSFPLRCTLEEV
jgi:ATP-dependent Clp protease adaptor protein ClpS